MPTTIAGLFDGFVTSPDIVKLFPDANKQALACHPAVMLLESASIQAFGAVTDKPSPLPPHPPVISPCTAVIPAPVLTCPRFMYQRKRGQEPFSPPPAWSRWSPLLDRAIACWTISEKKGSGTFFPSAGLVRLVAAAQPCHRMLDNFGQARVRG